MNAAAIRETDESYFGLDQGDVFLVVQELELHQSTASHIIAFLIFETSSAITRWIRDSKQGRARGSTFGALHLFRMEKLLPSYFVMQNSRRWYHAFAAQVKWIVHSMKGYQEVIEETSG